MLRLVESNAIIIIIIIIHLHSILCNVYKICLELIKYYFDCTFIFFWFMCNTF